MISNATDKSISPLGIVSDVASDILLSSSSWSEDVDEPNHDMLQCEK